MALSSSNVTTFLPLIIGFAIIVIGVIWMLIEGRFARKEYARDNDKRANRVAFAIVMSIIGLLIFTVAGFFLILQ